MNIKTKIMATISVAWVAFCSPLIADSIFEQKTEPHEITLRVARARGIFELKPGSQEITLQDAQDGGGEPVHYTLKKTVKGYFPNLQNPYEGWKSIKIDIKALSKGDFSAFGVLAEPERSLILGYAMPAHDKEMVLLQNVKQIDLGGILEIAPNHKFIFLRYSYIDPASTSNKAVEYKLEKDKAGESKWKIVPQTLTVRVRTSTEPTDTIVRLTDEKEDELPEPDFFKVLKTPMLLQCGQSVSPFIKVERKTSNEK
jgi:hypothetical protein